MSCFWNWGVRSSGRRLAAIGPAGLLWRLYGSGLEQAQELKVDRNSREGLAGKINDGGLDQLAIDAEADLVR